MPFSGQHVASNPPKFKLPHAIVAVGLLVTTTVVGLFGLDLYRSYQAEIDEAKRSTQGYAQVLAEHTEPVPVV